VLLDEIGDAPEKRPANKKPAPKHESARYRQGEANMEVIIAIGWIVGIWVVVLAFSVYFSQNLK